MVDGVAIGCASLWPRRTPRPAIGDPIAQATRSHRAEKRGGNLAREPAGQLIPFVSQQIAPLPVLQCYPSAIPDRLEPHPQRCHFRGLPISRMPLEYDFFWRLPEDYPPHFDNTFHHASVDSGLELHPESRQRSRQFLNKRLEGRR